MQVGSSRIKPEITTSIILDKRNARKDETYPVKLRVTFQRKYKYFGLKQESLKEDDFNKIYTDKPRGIFKQKRMQYDAVEMRAIFIIDHVLDDFNFDAFAREYKGVKNGKEDIKEYFDVKREELKQSGKLQSESLYAATWISLKKFDKNLTLNKIDPKYLKKYEDWMVGEGKTYTTIGMYMRNLRHIINRAIHDKNMNKYPFGNSNGLYQIPYSKSTKKALSLGEIQKLVTYKPNNKNEQKALDYWTFSYLCNGMNMIDIVNLRNRNIHDNSIQFIRQKTRDTSKVKSIIDVYILPETSEIMKRQGFKNNDPDDFIFPILQKGMDQKEVNATVKQHIKFVNKYIKRIAIKIEINENITTYYARHSYSTVLKRAGASIEFIGEQLGHQSTRVTRNYLDSFEEETRKKFAGNLLNFTKDEE